MLLIWMWHVGILPGVVPENTVDNKADLVTVRLTGEPSKHVRCMPGSCMEVLGNVCIDMAHLHDAIQLRV